MRNIYTIAAIQETATYKELVSKKENFKINLLHTRVVRERITHAVQVWKNTSHVPNTVSGMELSVVADLIAMSKQSVNNIEVDYSTVMTAENLNNES